MGLAAVVTREFPIEFDCQLYLTGARHFAH
jgi:hypothetical protein